ncbi:hypothetical protein [Leptospira brenneri]|uniref:Uncharacterized protein n=1 Tax=Leptospira brenneri TaxID=2023182 RepID=A0A2M9Y0Q6_9LEPT|nr:hypothetical protein [Leptospira brenneri]PJZ45154.1 hypothetical protein CH361_13075 [Leptospira brenneri]TGK95076.1 hypothetical protein EHQ30_00005 [Leptospira brenneri]
MFFKNRKYSIFVCMLVFVLVFRLFGVDVYLNPEEERSSLIHLIEERYHLNESYLKNRVKNYLEFRSNDYYIWFLFGSILSNSNQDEFILFSKLESSLRAEGYKSREWLYSSLVGAKLASGLYELSEQSFSNLEEIHNSIRRQFNFRKIYNHTLPLNSFAGNCPEREEWIDIMEKDVNPSNFYNGTKPVSYLLFSHFPMVFIGKCRLHSDSILNAILKTKSDREENEYSKALVSLFNADRLFFTYGDPEYNLREYRRIKSSLSDENFPRWFIENLNFRIGFLCINQERNCSEYERGLRNDPNLFARKDSILYNYILLGYKKFVQR